MGGGLHKKNNASIGGAAHAASGSVLAAAAKAKMESTLQPKATQEAKPMPTAKPTRASVVLDPSVNLEESKDAALKTPNAS